MHDVSKEFIINEIKRVALLLGRDDITREEFLKYSGTLNRSQIDKIFGGWANAFSEAGYKPLKWDSITNEQLFENLFEIRKKLGRLPQNFREIRDSGKYSGSVYKSRFKGGIQKANDLFKNWEKIKYPKEAENLMLKEK